MVYITPIRNERLLRRKKIYKKLKTWRFNELTMKMTFSMKCNRTLAIVITIHI